MYLPLKRNNGATINERFAIIITVVVVSGNTMQDYHKSKVVKLEDSK